VFCRRARYAPLIFAFFGQLSLMLYAAADATLILSRRLPFASRFA
jgi:hypothetical protein